MMAMSTSMLAAARAQDVTGFRSTLEILNLDADEMLLSLTGDEAVIAQKPNYLPDPIFQGQFDPNPCQVTADLDAIKAKRPQRVFKRLPKVR